MAQIDTDENRLAEINLITEQVIGCAFKVGNALGPGFVEKVYENALGHELRKAGLRVEQQHRFVVWYDGVQVGEFTADVFVEECVIVEIKAARALDEAHVGQCVNYLACTRQPIGLVLNFSTRVSVKRVAGPAALALPGCVQADQYRDGFRAMPTGQDMRNGHDFEEV